MELRQLKYFVKTAETLNFSEAAKTLFVTQSTLSQQIRQLEQEIDTVLFVRDSHSVQLTESGERLLPLAEKTLKDATSCLDMVRDLKNYIGEYDERQVLVPKDGTIISLDEFRKKVKPTLMPTYKMLKTNSKPGRPTQLTKPICMAILDKRSQGMSKNEASVFEGFARQAYNDALVRYGLVDDYPLGNWKP